MAEVPEGPPARFTWRRVTFRVVRAEGPERIAPEWWRALAARAIVSERRPEDDESALGEPLPPPSPNRPRDYYRLEDERGAGYWVFREGLYQSAAADGPPRWFLHGLFG